MNAIEPSRRSTRRGHRAATILIIAAIYILSSGPVIALGCRLRDATGWNSCYGVIYLYFPLAYWRNNLFEAYLGWWMWLFGTIGPG